IKDALGQRRLARIDVGGDADVADEIDVRHVCLAFLMPLGKGAEQLPVKRTKNQAPGGTLAPSLPLPNVTGDFLDAVLGRPVQEQRTPAPQSGPLAALRRGQGRRTSEQSPRWRTIMLIDDPD